MTVSNNTLSNLASLEYVRQFMNLDKDGFNKSLDDNVSGVHRRITGGVPGSPFEVKGKKDLYGSYLKYFFSVASNFDLHYIKCKAAGLQANIEYEADEDTTGDDGVVGRYRIHCFTELEFEKKEDVLKIVKIWENTSKILLK
jgi:hypothetical protein